MLAIVYSVDRGGILLPRAHQCVAPARGFAFNHNRLRYVLAVVIVVVVVVVLSSRSFVRPSFLSPSFSLTDMIVTQSRRRR